jgi:hypothetical protein
MTQFTVETHFYGDTWENCWTDDNGQPITFATREEAQEAINEHIADCNEAVEAGDMQGGFHPSEFRIMPPIKKESDQ